MEDAGNGKLKEDRRTMRGSWGSRSGRRVRGKQKSLIQVPVEEAPHNKREGPVRGGRGQSKSPIQSGIGALEGMAGENWKRRDLSPAVLSASSHLKKTSVHPHASLFSSALSFSFLLFGLMTSSYVSVLFFFVFFCFSNSVILESFHFSISSIDSGFFSSSSPLLLLFITSSIWSPPLPSFAVFLLFHSHALIPHFFRLLLSPAPNVCLFALRLQSSSLLVPVCWPRSS